MLPLGTPQTPLRKTRLPVPRLLIRASRIARTERRLRPHLVLSSIRSFPIPHNNDKRKSVRFTTRPTTHTNAVCTDQVHHWRSACRTPINYRH